LNYKLNPRRKRISFLGSRKRIPLGLSFLGIKKKNSPAPQESLDSDEAGEFYILL